MRYLHFGWMLVGVICYAANAASPVEAGDRWALLIGPDRYEQATVLRPLAYSGFDVIHMADTLVKSGYDRDKVIVMISSAKEDSLQPERDKIMKQIDRVVAATSGGSAESLMVVFAGHGVTIRGESYLCPADAKLDYSGAGSSERLLSVSTIATLMASSGAAQKYLIVDACREEFASRTRNSEFDLLSGINTMKIQGTGPEGIVYFASCLAKQRSIEDHDLRHGVFLYYFAEALNGLADVQSAGNRDGKVSSYEAFQYASDRTRERSRAMTGWEQQPWYEGRATAGLTLVSLPEQRRQELISQAPPEPTNISGAVLHSQLELTEALYALQEAEMNKVLEKSERAIRLDPSNRMATRTAALALQVLGRLPEAIKRMSEIKEPLTTRIGNSPVVVKANGEQVVGTAEVNDSLEIQSVGADPGDGAGPWLQVSGIRRKGSRLPEDYQKVSGWIRLANLSGAVRNVDQILEFGRENQQPVALEEYAYSDSSSVVALERYNEMRQVGEQIRILPGGQYIPPNPANSYIDRAQGVVEGFRSLFGD